MKTVIATGNKNKVIEIGEILGAKTDDVISMAEAGIDVDIIEDGETFIQNALIKARTVKKYWDGIVIADDSGLVIDALDGKPGVLSSRFMGEDTPYSIKNDAILAEMKNIEQEKRTARFVCAMAAILPDGSEICVEKTMEGLIAQKAAGNNGFGYDPIFYIPEKGKTSAELLPAEKNAISHRGKALRALRDELYPVKANIIGIKENAPKMACMSHEDRVDALMKIRDALIEKKEYIFGENSEDIRDAENANTPITVIKRLRFDDSKLDAVLDGVQMLIDMPDPLGKTSLKRELSKDLILERTSVPIGVIGVIFEARPDAMIQIAALCIKSGNLCILKGGKETERTNKAIFDVILEAIKQSNLPGNCVARVSSHTEIDELLTCTGAVDLIIPRGSKEFVKYVMNNTSIPVLGHADGICHIYVDEYADLNIARKVVLDAKTQYPAACNATETLLVSSKIVNEFLPAIYHDLKDTGVNIRGTRFVHDFIPCEIIADGDFENEYLDYTIAIKTVDNVENAVNHINKFGSHHTDCIITEDEKSWKYFAMMVDSAGVYRNVSTRFADGFRYGFGAEVGISTSKVHARGPVGLDGLMTYKYKLVGKGHTVGEFESKEKVYSFKDLD